MCFTWQALQKTTSTSVAHHDDISKPRNSSSAPRSLRMSLKMHMHQIQRTAPTFRALLHIPHVRSKHPMLSCWWQIRKLHLASIFKAPQNFVMLANIRWKRRWSPFHSKPIQVSTTKRLQQFLLKPGFMRPIMLLIWVPRKSWMDVLFDNTQVQARSLCSLPAKSRWPKAYIARTTVRAEMPDEFESWRDWVGIGSCWAQADEMSDDKNWFQGHCRWQLRWRHSSKWKGIN